MPWHPDMARIIEAVQSAPSIFDKRPWEAVLAGETRNSVELYANADRVPDDISPREVAISCGAALYNLRLALRVAGREPSVWMLPGLDQGSPLIDHLGTGRVLVASVEVSLDRIAPPTAGVQELYEAMWLRHINPGQYAAEPVPLPLLVEMEDAAAEEHGWLRILHPREQKAILRATVRGGELAARDMQLMTLSTDDDRPLDWLRAGQALQHALLTGTRYSMSTGSGRGERYRSSLKYRLSDFHPLHPPDRVPSSYGVTASFLTQSLEREDQQGISRRWPWPTFYNEVPQVVLQVGFAPVERVPAPPLYGAEPTETE
jgi:hypothetical protein